MGVSINGSEKGLWSSFDFLTRRKRVDSNEKSNSELAKELTFLHLLAVGIFLLLFHAQSFCFSVQNTFSSLCYPVSFALNICYC